MSFSGSTAAAGRAVGGPRLLGDLLGSSATARAVRVVAAAGVIALSAQMSLPLPGTPVPFTLQTFAVLVLAAALGPFEGTAAVALYLGAGAAGAPVFHGGTSGMTGPAVGYLLGMLLAAPVVGLAALRGVGRHVPTTVALMVVGSLLIYLVGTVWLAAALHVGAGTAVRLGVLPFVPGDAVKAAAAGVLLPGLWRVLRP